MPITQQSDAVMYLFDERRNGREAVLFTTADVAEKVAAAREEGRRLGTAQPSSQIAAAREEGRLAGRAEAAAEAAAKRPNTPDAVAAKASNHGWDAIIDRMNKTPPSARIS